MYNIIVKDAIQAVLFSLVITVIYFIGGRFGSPADMTLVLKSFVTFAGIFFVLNVVIDFLFKNKRK